MTESESTDLEVMLKRFRRLLGELIRGATGRNSFAPWELTLLLDLEQCNLNPRRRLETLRQYQRAVERQMATGPGPPMKLSDFLDRKKQRRMQPGDPVTPADLPD
jgi:hypothetical protein